MYTKRGFFINKINKLWHTESQENWPRVRRAFKRLRNPCSDLLAWSVLGLTAVEGIIFLANSASFRRHLTDAQKYQIAKALEAEFAKEAKKAQGQGNDLKQDFPANLQESKSKRESATKAAEAVGMSPGQFHRAKTIDPQVPEPVIEEILVKLQQVSQRLQAAEMTVEVKA